MSYSILKKLKLETIDDALRIEFLQRRLRTSIRKPMFKEKVLALHEKKRWMNVLVLLLNINSSV